MRIQHNIAALNSYRQLGTNNNAVSKNLEKLSSGYRINRAGDDAAGLAISEKMRAQITGLETAQKNANDGISLVQTAEGALTEVHSMLNRMVELADQSANGTYQDAVDRENLQKEMDSLKSEINRISESTNFNGINLLDGSLSKSGGNISSNLEVSTSKVVTGSSKSGNFTDGAGKADAGDTVSYTVAWTDANGEEKSTTVHLTVNETSDKLVAKDGTEYTLDSQTAKKGDLQAAILAELKKNSDLTSSFNIETDTDALKFTSTVAGANGAKIDALQMVSSDTTNLVEADGIASGAVQGQDAYQIVDFSKITAVAANATSEDINNSVFEIDGKKFVFAQNGVTDEQLKNVASDVTVIKLAGNQYATADAKNVATTISRVTGKEFEVSAGDSNAGISANAIIYKGKDVLSASGKQGLTLQIGDTSADFNQLTVSVDSMDVNSLGLSGVDISTQSGAKAAVDVIKNAINKVSSTRGDLGAIQNRLEHTINNLSVTTENMTAAESRIRDVDMASEMMAYTKNNILVQASQSMLAQANQQPQGVLQLLQ